MIDNQARHLFPVKGSAGGAVAPVASSESFYEDWVEFSDMLYRPERFAIQIAGDSMSPRLQHGDYLLIQPTSKPPSGVLVVVKTPEGEFACKLFKQEGTKATLHCLNEDYPPVEVGLQWEVIGMVVAYRRQLGPKRYIEEADGAGLRP